MEVGVVGTATGCLTKSEVRALVEECWRLWWARKAALFPSFFFCWIQDLRRSEGDSARIMANRYRILVVPLREIQPFSRPEGGGGGGGSHDSEESGKMVKETVQSGTECRSKRRSKKSRTNVCERTRVESGDGNSVWTLEWMIHHAR